MVIVWLVEFLCQFVKTRWRMLVLVLLIQSALTAYAIFKAFELREGIDAYIGLYYITQESGRLLGLLGDRGDVWTILGTRHIGNFIRAITIAGWWWLVIAVFSWHRLPEAVEPSSHGDEKPHTDKDYWIVVVISSVVSAVLWLLCEYLFDDDDVTIFQFLIFQIFALSILYTSARYDEKAPPAKNPHSHSR